MTVEGDPPGPLAGVRVVELDSPLTAHAGRLLWELGAEVVLVEPVGGSPTRQMAGGAAYAHHHAGKTSVALGNEGADRAELARLVVAADVVLEAVDGGRPPRTAGLPRRPDAVHVVLSPFGTTGPRAGWQGSDLVVCALGGMASQVGWPSGPPEAPPADQAWHLAGCNGAIGTLLALTGRARAGLGQEVEVSALESVAASLETGALLYIHTDSVGRRTGTEHPVAPHRLFRAFDGWVAGGLGGNPRMWDGLLRWMEETGEADDLLEAERRDPARLPEHRDHVFSVIEAFTRRRERNVLFHEAQHRRLPWAAVVDLDEVAASPQLRARGALVDVAFDGGTGTDLAPPVRRATTLRVAAPLGGRTGPAWADAPPAPAVTAAPSPGTTLDDVTVLDLTWVLAGPYATRILADHGASVVKVESRHRPDPTRFSSFSHLSRGGFDPDTSGYFNDLNRNKRSITLNLRSSDGVSAFLRLVESADVVFENFSAGALERMGIGPSTLLERNPHLIVVSMSGLGATGPWAGYVSYADAVSALSGFTTLAIDGDRPSPVVHGLADIVAGNHAALAALAALLERRTTGRGTVVDLSQLEAIACQTGHSVLARTAAGTPPRRRGSMGRAAPEGVYPCLGPDRWVAITVPDDAAWQGLCGVMDLAGLAVDGRLRTAAGRDEHAAEVDDAIRAWTGPRPAEDVAARLQEAGVPAGPVQDGRDLVEHDPQLRARRFYEVLHHPRAGPFLHEGIPIRLAATPGRLRAPAPVLGQDTEAVLAELGAMTPDEISALRAAGALE